MNIGNEQDKWFAGVDDKGEPVTAQARVVVTRDAFYLKGKLPRCLMQIPGIRRKIFISQAPAFAFQATEVEALQGLLAACEAAQEIAETELAGRRKMLDKVVTTLAARV